VAKPRKPTAGAAPVVEELQALLRGAGLRSTAPRVTVLAFFHERGGQHSHAETFEALGEGLDRATVYRVLMDLAEAKLLSRTDLGDHVWRFELRKAVGGVEHDDEHPHFVCVDCGQVSCLQGLSVKLEGKGKAPRAVTSQRVAVQLRGRCDDCG